MAENLEREDHRVIETDVPVDYGANEVVRPYNAGWFREIILEHEGGIGACEFGKFLEAHALQKGSANICNGYFPIVLYCCAHNHSLSPT